MRQIRTGLALLLALCFLTVSVLAAGCAFTDLDGSPASGAASVLADQGLMNGVGEDRFAPDDPMTRAMLAAILFRLAGEDPADYTETPLTDAPAECWYGPAAFWAWQAGLLGDDSLNFAPERAITLSELLTALCRYAGDFSSDPVTWGKALADHLNGALQEADTLTRAQAAMVLAAFAEMERPTPLTLLDLSSANPTFAALTDRDGGHSYTWTRTLYTGGEITLREEQSRRYLPDGDNYLVELSWDSYGVRAVYTRDKAFGAEGDGIGLFALTPGECRKIVDDLCGERLFEYTARERIIGLTRTDGTYAVKTLVTYEGGSTTYTYTLDEGDLRILEFLAEDFDENGARFGSVNMAVCYEAPTVDTAFLARIEAMEQGARRTCTRITDPGTPQENVETFSVPEGCYFYFPEITGYGYFLDPGGAAAMEDEQLPPHGDITIYRIPTEK